MAAKLPDNLNQAIAALAKDGTIIEAGIINVLRNKGIGIVTREMPTALAYFDSGGNTLRIRKNLMPLGGNRDQIKNSNFFYNASADMQELKVDSSYWLRVNWDLEALRALGRAYEIPENMRISSNDSPETKVFKENFANNNDKNLREQLVSMTIGNAVLNITAKIDAEFIDVVANSLTATEVFTDLSTMKPAQQPPLLIDKVLGLQTDIAFALANLETKISAQNLGTDIENYRGLWHPILSYLQAIFYRNYTGTDESNRQIKDGSTQIFQGVKFEKHPFFNQVVNTKATDLSNIDRTKTIFDISTTYDFTNILGIIWHKYAAVVAVNLEALQLTIDPDTIDPQLIGRVFYKVALVRDDLIIKILNQASDQTTYDSEIQTFVNNYANPANAMTIAAGVDIVSTVQAVLRIYKGAQTTANFSAIVVNWTPNPKADAVTGTAKTTVKVQIPAVGNKKVAVYENLEMVIYYKNS